MCCCNLFQFQHVSLFFCITTFILDFVVLSVDDLSTRLHFVCVFTVINWLLKTGYLNRNGLKCM